MQRSQSPANYNGHPRGPPNYGLFSAPSQHDRPAYRLFPAPPAKPSTPANGMQKASLVQLGPPRRRRSMSLDQSPRPRIDHPRMPNPPFAESRPRTPVKDYRTSPIARNPARPPYTTQIPDDRRHSRSSSAPQDFILKERERSRGADPRNERSYDPRLRQKPPPPPSRLREPVGLGLSFESASASPDLIAQTITISRPHTPPTSRPHSPATNTLAATTPGLGQKRKLNHNLRVEVDKASPIQHGVVVENKPVVVDKNSRSEKKAMLEKPLPPPPPPEAFLEHQNASSSDQSKDSSRRDSPVSPMSVVSRPPFAGPTKPSATTKEAPPPLSPVSALPSPKLSGSFDTADIPPPPPLKKISRKPLPKSASGASTPAKAPLSPPASKFQTTPAQPAEQVKNEAKSEARSPTSPISPISKFYIQPAPRVDRPSSNNKANNPSHTSPALHSHVKQASRQEIPREEHTTSKQQPTAPSAQVKIEIKPLPPIDTAPILDSKFSIPYLHSRDSDTLPRFEPKGDAMSDRQSMSSPLSPKQPVSLHLSLKNNKTVDVESSLSAIPSSEHVKDAHDVRDRGTEGSGGDTAHLTSQARVEPAARLQQPTNVQRRRGSTHPPLSQPEATNDRAPDGQKIRIKPSSMNTDSQSRSRSALDRADPQAKRDDRSNAPPALQPTRRHHFSGELMPRSKPMSPHSMSATPVQPPQLKIFTTQLSAPKQSLPPLLPPPSDAPPPVPAKNPEPPIQQDKKEPRAPDHARNESKKSLTTVSSTLEDFKARLADMSQRTAKAVEPPAKDEASLLAALADLSRQSEALHDRYTGLRAERQKLSSSIMASLKDGKPSSDYANVLMDKHVSLAAITSSMDICFAKLKSLDCRKEEAITALLALLSPKRQGSSRTRKQETMKVKDVVVRPPLISNNSHSSQVSVKLDEEANRSRGDSHTQPVSRSRAASSSKETGPSSTDEHKRSNDAVKKTPVLSAKEKGSESGTVEEKALEQHGTNTHDTVNEDLESPKKLRIKGVKAAKVLGLSVGKGNGADKDITLPDNVDPAENASRLVVNIQTTRQARTPPPQRPLPSLPKRNTGDSLPASASSVASTPEDQDLWTPHEETVSPDTIKSFLQSDVRVFLDDDVLEYYQTAR